MTWLGRARLGSARRSVVGHSAARLGTAGRGGELPVWVLWLFSLGVIVAWWFLVGALIWRVT